MAEFSTNLYELCQASQLVPFPTSPKITSRRDRFLLWAVSEGRGRGGGPWCRLWAWGGVGGFVMTRLFSQTVSLDFHVVLGSGRTVIGMSHFLAVQFRTTAQRKRLQLSNSLFLLVWCSVSGL